MKRLMRSLSVVAIVLLSTATAAVAYVPDPPDRIDCNDVEGCDLGTGIDVHYKVTRLEDPNCECPKDLDIVVELPLHPDPNIGYAHTLFSLIDVPIIGDKRFWGSLSPDYKPTDVNNVFKVVWTLDGSIQSVGCSMVDFFYGEAETGDTITWNGSEWIKSWGDGKIGVPIDFVNQLCGPATIRDYCDKQTFTFDVPTPYSSVQIGQTITPSSDYQLKYMKFYACYASAYADPGTCYVSWQETTGGLPNGNLVTNRAPFTVTDTETLITVNFTIQPVLKKGVKYSSAIEVPDGINVAWPNDEDNRYLLVWGSTSGNYYLGGERVWYNRDTSTWQASSQDLNFYCYGASTLGECYCAGYATTCIITRLRPWTQFAPEHLIDGKLAVKFDGLIEDPNACCIPSTLLPQGWFRLDMINVESTDQSAEFCRSIITSDGVKVEVWARSTWGPSDDINWPFQLWGELKGRIKSPDPNCDWVDFFEGSAAGDGYYREGESGPEYSGPILYMPTEYFNNLSIANGDSYEGGKVDGTAILDLGEDYTPNLFTFANLALFYTSDPNNELFWNSFQFMVDEWLDPNDLQGNGNGSEMMTQSDASMTNMMSQPEESLTTMGQEPLQIDQQIQTDQQINQINIEKILEWLNEIWLDPEVRKAITKAEWQEFIENVRMKE